MYSDWNLWAQLAGMYNITAAVKNNMAAPQKLKVELPYNVAILLLGIYIQQKKKKTESKISKRQVHSSQKVEATQVSKNEQKYGMHIQGNII